MTSVAATATTGADTPIATASPTTVGAGDPPVRPEPSRWRRVLTDRRAMHHHRLIVAVVAVNLVALASGAVDPGWSDPGGGGVASLAAAAAVNLSVAVLIRNQQVINLLFRVATSAPLGWPLPVRRLLGKVYHFGGIHVGAAVVGTVWFAALAVVATRHRFLGTGGVATAELGVVWALVGVLALIVATALPGVRARAHDRFERVHRFGGWTALVLFWVSTVQLAAPTGGGGLVSTLATDPVVWLLAASTVSVALPWLRLRRVPVEITRPSDHVALVGFDHGVTPFAGSSTVVSRNPLLEWHAFANIPTPGRDGFRLAVSRAGDWTGALIDDLPQEVWVKGVPTAGVGNIDRLFRRVVWVATGSGIGPTLPHLLTGEVPAHLIWSTRNPERTYGADLVAEIRAAQPDALIWDTDADGKPDLVDLARRAVADTGAEAVICIANRRLTWEVVEGMERLGIPAFGAIWDS